MAVHEDFVTLLADIEIYVDAIAEIQIQNLNAWVGVVRDEIVAKYNPGSDDPHLRLMNAAQINEDQYFANIVHEDIDRIIADIRKAHKGSATSAPDTTAVEQLKKGLEVAANFEGSPQEKQLVALCWEFGIDYKSLTAEEFRFLMRIFQKSKHLKSPISRRGKQRRKR